MRPVSERKRSWPDFESWRIEDPEGRRAHDQAWAETYARWALTSDVTFTRMNNSTWVGKPLGNELPDQKVKGELGP